MTLTGDTTMGATAVSFGNTVDGAHALTVSGNATFGGAVGSHTALTSFGVTGTTALNGGTVDTTAGQTYSGAVTLGGNNSLSDTGASGVDFVSTLDGAHALTVSGNAMFGGVVGGQTALTSLGVTGTTALNGGTVDTTAGQIYSALSRSARTIF